MLFSLVQKHLGFSIFFVALFFLPKNSLHAQVLAEISGEIVDGSTQEKLQGALISLKKNHIQFSNEKGVFQFSDLEPREYHLSIRAKGYQERKWNIQIVAGQKLVLHIAMKPLIRQDEEVIISASRTSETLSEVPSSVTVIGKNHLAKQQAVASSMADVLSEIPGMAMGSGSLKNDTQSLRGRTPLVLIDGIPQSTPLRNMHRDINAVDLNMLERVEVIKGATAVYGNGSDGGIINFITKKPPKGKPFAALTRLFQTGPLSGFKKGAGIGIYQEFSGKPGSWDYIISGLYESTGVFYDARSRVMSPFYGMGENRTYAIFGKFGYDITPDERIEWMLSYYRSLQYTQYIGARDGRYGKHPETGVLGHEKGKPQGVPHNFNSRFTYNLRGVFSSDTDLEMSLYLQNFNALAYFNEKFYDPSTGKKGGQSQVLASKKGWRMNLDTPFYFSQAIYGKLLYGLDVLNDKTRQSLLDGRNWVPELNMWNYAPYAQLKLYVLGDWLVKGGVRFDNIQVYVPDYTTLHLSDKGKTTGGVAVTGGKLSYGSTVFNLGLRYNRFKVFKPFLSFSQSFSIAQIGRELRDVPPGKGGTFVKSIRPKAVIANNYEFGFDSYPNHFVHLTGSLFLSTSELGAQLVSVDGIYKVSRAPERIYGCEAQVNFFPLKKWTTGVSLAYIQGQIDKSGNLRYDDPEDAFINSLRIPPFKVSSYIEYDDKKRFQFRLSGLFSASRALFSPQKNGRYKEGEGPILPITLIHLATTYRLSKQLRLELGIQNLFNKEYYSQSSMILGRDDRYIQGSGARYRLGLHYVF